jgi:hypothetical protein
MAEEFPKLVPNPSIPEGTKKDKYQRPTSMYNIVQK